jgi:hypothetical protein
MSATFHVEKKKKEHKEGEIEDEEKKTELLRTYNLIISRSSLVNDVSFSSPMTLLFM